MMQYSNKLYDLSDPAVDGRWLDWKAAAATDADGRLVGYGTDIGPEAICYRSDLFAEAGLPTDRAEVAAYLEGDWDRYFEVGHEYVAKTGKAWYDSAGATYQGMSNQFSNFYEKNDGTIIATENADVEKTFRTVLEESADLSAKLGQWSDDWFGALSTGGYATMLCPGWMLGVISGNAADTTGWDIADVFPGGGGNWGGSYLTVPAQGKHTEEAKKFAAWLTAPEQQIKAFQNAGTFPSQVAAYDDSALTGAVNEYFNNAPVGEILINRANAVDPTPPFKGPHYFQVNDAAQQALTRVEEGQQSIDESWAQFVSEVEALG
jgi:cellobiose transport system substrate-binding protein